MMSSILMCLSHGTCSSRTPYIIYKSSLKSMCCYAVISIAVCHDIEYLYSEADIYRAHLLFACFGARYLSDLLYFFLYCDYCFLFVSYFVFVLVYLTMLFSYVPSSSYIILYVRTRGAIFFVFKSNIFVFFLMLI